MRMTSEFTDKRIMELCGSPPGDLYDHSYIHGHGDDDDSDFYEDDGFSFFPTQSAHSRAIREEEWIAFNEALLSLIEKKMKENKEEVLRAVEGISARLSQLEARTRGLENSVDELKNSLEYNQGKTDGKLRELEILLREVQCCTKDIRDKQEIALAQADLIRHKPKAKERDEKQGNTNHADSSEANSSSASVVQPQPLPEQPPVPSFHSQVPCMPPLSNPSPTILTMPPLLPIRQLNPFVSCEEACYQPPVLNPEAPNQPFQMPPTPTLHPLPPWRVLPSVPLPSESVHYWPSEFSHTPSSSHPPFETPRMRPPPPPMQDLPIQKPFPELSNTYLQPLQESIHMNGNFSMPMGNFQNSHSSLMPDVGSGHLQLPVARVLPHALPTASLIDSDSRGNETGNGVRTEDVVQKVVSMGFRRDVVRATVKRLKERGQPLDLNAVLDLMMNNNGDPMVQNQRLRQDMAWH